MGATRLLVANRGEIAVRILRAAADLGWRTVAVHTPDDAASLHVRRADEAKALPATGVAGYLDIDAVVEAARETGCDAIHPGYGFLAENAAFARRCAEAGLTFVGPSPELLELFGDKVAARELARRCSVPVLAGTDGPTSRRGGRRLPRRPGRGRRADDQGGRRRRRARHAGRHPAGGPRGGARPLPLGGARRVRQRRRLRRAAAAVGPAMSRSRSSVTAAARSRTSASGSARSSAATRSWWSWRRAPTCPRSGGVSCSRPRCASPPRCATPASGPSSSCSMQRPDAGPAPRAGRSSRRTPACRSSTR